MWLSYAKNRVDIFCRLSTMHEIDRQTDSPRNRVIDRNRRSRFSAMSPNNNK